MSYKELETVVKKLFPRLANFHCFNQIYKTCMVYTYIASSNHILVITLGEQSNVSTTAMNLRVGCQQYLVTYSTTHQV